MARIVSLGSALQDIYLIDRDDFIGAEVGGASIFSQLLIGTKVDIDRISYEVGGGGTNSATSFARHGHEAIYIGNIGHDPAGEAILAVLDQEGIDTSYVNNLTRKTTGCSTILLDVKSGERTILTHRGASAQFSNLDPADLDLIQPDWIYISTLRGDMDTILKFIEKAHSIGCKVMFNPGSLELAEPKKLLGLLRDVDALIVNKFEAAQIVPGQVLAELLSHLANYVPTAIITDGAMGAIATNGEESYRLGVYEHSKVKDTTGAGDAFGSGFLAHLAAGHSFRSSLIFAAANSASVVRQFGAKRGILTGRESLHPMPIQKIK